MNNMTKKGAEQVLGLSGDYTRADLRQAYKRQALLCHPDVAQRHGMDAETAGDLMVDVNVAFKTLSALFRDDPEAVVRCTVTAAEDFNPDPDPEDDDAGYEEEDEERGYAPTYEETPEETPQETRNAGPVRETFERIYDRIFGSRVFGVLFRFVFMIVGAYFLRYFVLSVGHSDFAGWCLTLGSCLLVPLVVLANLFSGFASDLVLSLVRLVGVLVCSVADLLVGVVTRARESVA